MALKTRLEKLFSVLFALTVWQIGAMILNRSILLVTPIVVAQRLSTLCTESDFISAVLFSLLRIVLGFLLALITGSVLAMISGRFRIVELLLWPFITAIKSTPVASFIILCLIWLSSRNLSVFISFLMVLPIVYTNMLQGINSADSKLLEMAALFRVGWLRRLKYIHMPHLQPYISAACSVSVGLAWKAGIAAEVIGIPSGSIGEKLYEAKIYFASGDLFAWTVVIVAISVLFEKFFLFALKRIFIALEGEKFRKNL